jgi:hypothetical protein
MTKKNGKKNINLADNYVPGKYAVICGRGRACTAWTGNRNLRALVISYLKPYSQAKNKVEKSSIVSVIIESVRQASPDGPFVKFEASGVWREVDEGFAREKIGQMFRDYLHTQYRSSTKAKRRLMARRKVTTSSSLMMNHHGLDDSCHQSVNNSSHSRSSNYMNDGGSSNHSHSSMNMMMNGSNHIRSSYYMIDENNNAGPCEPLLAFPSGMDKFAAQAGAAPVKNMNNYYSLQSSYLNQQQSPHRIQELRSDFLEMCLPSMPIEGQGTSRNGCWSSLLQDVCNVMGIGNEGDDYDNIPDDISEIFEDDLCDPFAFSY